jgi:hypothetical protein
MYSGSCSNLSSNAVAASDIWTVKGFNLRLGKACNDVSVPLRCYVDVLEEGGLEEEDSGRVESNEMVSSSLSAWVVSGVLYESLVHGNAQLLSRF